MGEVSALANANPNKQPTVRARVRFAKTGVMRFVGHLDMMRFFQKAVRRAGLPIAYTGGFHPHQIMSFALPLGIGVTSEGEYMDIELTEKVDPEEAVRRLSEQMADGVEVLAFRYLPEKSKKAMAAVEAARYVVGFRELGDEAVHGLVGHGADGLVRTDGLLDDVESFAETEGLESMDTLAQTNVSFSDGNFEEINFTEQLKKRFCEGIQHFYKETDEIIITKKTKKSERQVDLKPLIYEFEVRDADDEAVTDLSSVIDDSLSNDVFHSSYFLLTLSAGSTDNIKPELVFSHFMKSLGVDEDDYRLEIHRLDLLGKEEGKLVSLGEIGVF